MNKLYFFIDDLKSNVGDFVINTLIITFAAVFINFALYSVSDYLASMSYYFNPNTQNIIKLLRMAESEEEIIDFEELDYRIDECFYQGALAGGELITVSEKYLDEELGLISAELGRKMRDTSEAVQVIAFSDSGLSKGSTGTLANGVKYTVAEVFDNSAPSYLISGFYGTLKSIVALDTAIDTEGFGLNGKAVIGKLNGISTDGFKEKYGDGLEESGWIATGFNGFEAIASEYESSVTMTLVGSVVFLTACVAILINNYLSYEKRKRAYEILLTVGARRKLFIFSSMLTRLLQLAAAAVLSVAVAFLGQLLIGSQLFSMFSFVISVAVTAVLLGVGLARYAWFVKRTEAAR